MLNKLIKPREDKEVNQFLIIGLDDSILVVSVRTFFANGIHSKYKETLCYDHEGRSS